ncbi:MAG TPA: hypothetical protein PK954_14415, partial [Anaerolineales bacterium]|nr:hypothetical protein [Anaerolineales bacterium]
KLLGELGHDVSALGIARAYVGLVDMLLIDTLDAALAPEIEALGLRAIVAESVMRTDADRAALARRVLASAGV